MLVPTTARYSLVSLPPRPARQDLHRLVEPYQAMIVTQLRAILARTERSAFYPWIDTKINLTTGEDLPADDPLLGRDVVSGWVQGRGLETISRFAAWLAPFAGEPEVDALIKRSRCLAADLLAKLRTARSANAGHLYFFMTPAGQAFCFGPERARRPLTLSAGSQYGYSDLFGAKGMYAAAYLLGDAAAIAEARSYCLDVYRAILAGTFRSDQPQPETGARAWIDGAISHGPAMISLGMAALFAEFEPGPEAADFGLALARYVLGVHVNLAGRWPELREFDLVEFVDAAGKPFENERGEIISDPGHALEFVGLFLKFSRAVRQHGGATAEQAEALHAAEALMPSVLRRAFENGYAPTAGGICKTMDLLTRRRLDDTMPWWSLPETIRAAVAAAQCAENGADGLRCLEILALAHNDFVTHYVRPAMHLMAVKVRDGRGQPLDVMPAYPDADPGYHTALSLIDALALIEELRSAR